MGDIPSKACTFVTQAKINVRNSNDAKSNPVVKNGIVLDLSFLALYSCTRLVNPKPRKERMSSATALMPCGR